MLMIVDHANGHFIQKVVNPTTGLVLRYQYVPENAVGDASQVKEVATLTEARQAIGHNIVTKVMLTKPKMEHPQNQPGYKAPAGTGKTEQLGKTRKK